MTMTATATATPRRARTAIATADERAAAGRAARASRAAAVAGCLGSGTGPGTGRSTTLQRQAETRVPELVPIRYGRMVVVAVRVLPGRRGDHGRRPRRLAAHRARGAAVRRRPPVQLRRLRGTRSSPGVQHQRLRRDPSRTVRVGRQAARRQLRRRRATAGLQRPEAALDRDGRGRRLPAGDAVVRRDELAGRLVHPPRRRRHRPPVRRERPRQADAIRRDTATRRRRRTA